MSPRSDHSPLASRKANPLMHFPGYVNPTTGRCGGSCFQHQRCVGSSIKGDREFAVPIRASLSKPGAGRIKAQSHLPANPRQECFLSGIVFFSSLQARSAAPTPTLCTGPAPSHPRAGRSGHPNFPQTVHQPHFKGADLSRRDAGALRRRKDLVSTLRA